MAAAVRGDPQSGVPPAALGRRLGVWTAPERSPGDLERPPGPPPAVVTHGPVDRADAAASPRLSARGAGPHKPGAPHAASSGPRHAGRSAHRRGAAGGELRLGPGWPPDARVLAADAPALLSVSAARRRGDRTARSGGPGDRARSLRSAAGPAGLGTRRVRVQSPGTAGCRAGTPTAGTALAAAGAPRTGCWRPGSTAVSGRRSGPPLGGRDVGAALGGGPPAHAAAPGGVGALPAGDAPGLPGRGRGAEHRGGRRYPCRVAGGGHTQPGSTSAAALAGGPRGRPCPTRERIGAGRHRGGGGRAEPSRGEPSGAHLCPAPRRGPPHAPQARGAYGRSDDGPDGDEPAYGRRCPPETVSALPHSTALPTLSTPRVRGGATGARPAGARRVVAQRPRAGLTDVAHATP